MEKRLVLKTLLLRFNQNLFTFAIGEGCEVHVSLYFAECKLLLESLWELNPFILLFVRALNC